MELLRDSIKYFRVKKIFHCVPRTKEKDSGIVTLQKRLFGRKNSQNDPLPVVLLSYKADYDEILPQGLSESTTTGWLS